ncbi:PREDICTED: putative transcription factor p65 homolog isoform X2 [Nicrophorus vespilloides]|uniref:Transcription factor p65 homolog isoform X2 n=1 Tax=Nicrophorus vespilloides TaxID=110193 RepID=A0ABM1N2V2_NICVS|nr:PREDICTED: putative transcription factor p65 homolog isoform X2 [Nicrophorus vespilloides]
MDEHSLGPARQLQQRPIEESINISDVIEVIETDPDFKQATCLSSSSSSSPPQTTSSSVTRSNGSAGTGTMFNNSPIDPAQIRRQATVRIIEQPASKALRFRYECEGRSAGSIPGVNSTAENKTFPTIQIDGYKGKAVVVVSCVTKDHPHRPHPHNLVGRDGCKRGVCTMEISPDSMSISFSNLGIQCVKKKDIEAHLRVREEIRVDPFKTGYTHRSQPTSIDLNSVRLCFQVFTEGDKPGKFTVPLQPVVSDPIYDKKSMTDLTIVKLSDCVSSVDGGRKDIIVLCEKVSKEDIQIRFYEEKDGLVVWEGLGDFQPSQVHKQTAIWFKTPRYRTLDITEPVKVNIQLRRPSDGAISEPLPFELLPLDSGIKRKRKFEPDPNGKLIRQLPEQDNDNRDASIQFNIRNMQTDVKVEPLDVISYRSPIYTGGAMSPIYPTSSMSPQQMYSMPVHVNLGPTPPPVELQQFINYPPNNNLNPGGLPQTIGSIAGGSSMPSASGVLPSMNSWNIPSSMQPPMQPTNVVDLEAGTRMSMSGLSSLLDLDSQQMELRQINLNSGELGDLGTNNLSENFTQNLSLSDMPRVDNMTDSLTRLAQTTYDKMCG